MPLGKAFQGLAVLLAPAAALAAPAQQSQRSALSVSATVVPACEVALTADASRLLSARLASSPQLAVASCTAGTAPQVAIERAAPARPSAGTAAAADGTLYVTLTY